jgi:hypothetical protein
LARLNFNYIVVKILIFGLSNFMNTKTLAFAAVALILMATSCKIDAPVLPQGLILKDGSITPTKPGDGGNTTPTDPDTDATYTVGIGADDSFI